VPFAVQAVISCFTLAVGSVPGGRFQARAKLGGGAAGDETPFARVERFRRFSQQIAENRAILDKS